MRDSFGISTEYAEYVYEQVYLLNQRMNLSIFDVEELPVGLRKFYVEKIVKSAKEEQGPNKITLGG